LNAQGLVTGKKRPWTASAVYQVRSRLRVWHAVKKLGSETQPLRRGDGLYSVRGLAAKYGLPVEAIYYLLRTGQLTAEARGGTGHPLWIRLTDNHKKLLQATVRRRQHRSRHE
jgi:hypothetical protein